jgi:hypothetical protein
VAICGCSTIKNQPATLVSLLLENLRKKICELKYFKQKHEKSAAKMRESLKFFPCKLDLLFAVVFIERGNVEIKWLLHSAMEISPVFPHFSLAD